MGNGLINQHSQAQYEQVDDGTYREVSRFNAGAMENQPATPANDANDYTHNANRNSNRQNSSRTRMAALALNSKL